MYQAETPSGLSKYKDNEKGKMTHPHFQHTLPTLKRSPGSPV